MYRKYSSGEKASLGCKLVTAGAAVALLTLIPLKVVVLFGAGAMILLGIKLISGGR